MQRTVVRGESLSNPAFAAASPTSEWVRLSITGGRLCPICSTYVRYALAGRRRPKESSYRVNDKLKHIGHRLQSNVLFNLVLELREEAVRTAQDRVSVTRWPHLLQQPTVVMAFDLYP